MRAFSGNTAGSQHLLPRRLHEEEQIEFLTDVSGDFGAGVGFLALAVGVGSLAYETATEPSDQRAVARSGPRMRLATALLCVRQFLKRA